MALVINEKVLYNKQIDNIAVQHISGGSQCGYTSCGMVASILDPMYGKDEWIKLLVGMMETEKGIYYSAIKKEYPSLYGRLGARGEAYFVVLKELLKQGPYPYKAGFIPTGGNLSNIKQVIDAGGVILLSTMLAPSGHYIAVIGYRSDDNGNIVSFICHDPAGDQRKKYFNDFGEKVEYILKEMNKYFIASSLDKKSYRMSYLIPA